MLQLVDVGDRSCRTYAGVAPDWVLEDLFRAAERHRGARVLIEAAYFIDATPMGDLLALGNVEHALGAESRAETGEPHAPEHANPRDQQAITVCFAMEHHPDRDHTIDRPRQYETWRDRRPAGWPGPILDWTAVKPETGEPTSRPLFGTGDEKSWWNFRRILDKSNFEPGFCESDVTVVNWPQNDYWFGPVCEVDDAERALHVEAARQLSVGLGW